MLSRAHLAIDWLGGSLVAERTAQEDERRHLAAAWLQVHEDRQAREEEWWRAAEETASCVITAWEAAAMERLLAATDAEKELMLRERELALLEMEQWMERTRLEQIDEGLAAHEKEFAIRQAALDERGSKLHADVDARLVKKRDALEKEYL